MAAKQFGVDIDLLLNQLLNGRIENGTGFVSGGSGSIGRVVYDTTAQRILYDDGVNMQTLAILTDVTGLLDFKGGYNATANTPNLTSGVGVLKGDYYVVTTAGTFYGQQLEIGDSLFAQTDAPVTLAGWTLVQGNVVAATETVAGIAEIATQAEVDAGTDDARFVTPLKLKAASYLSQAFVSASTSVGGGTAVTITHNLGNLKPAITIVRDSTGAVIDLAIDNFTANSFDITKNGASYNVTVGVVG